MVRNRLSGGGSDDPLDKIGHDTREPYPWLRWPRLSGQDRGGIEGESLPVLLHPRRLGPDNTLRAVPAMCTTMVRPAGELCQDTGISECPVRVPLVGRVRDLQDYVLLGPVPGGFDNQVGSPEAPSGIPVQLVSGNFR